MVVVANFDDFDAGDQCDLVVYVMESWPRESVALAFRWCFQTHPDFLCIFYLFKSKERLPVQAFAGEETACGDRNFFLCAQRFDLLLARVSLLLWSSQQGTLRPASRASSQGPRALRAAQALEPVGQIRRIGSGAW